MICAWVGGCAAILAAFFSSASRCLIRFLSSLLLEARELALHAGHCWGKHLPNFLAGGGIYVQIGHLAGSSSIFGHRALCVVFARASLLLRTFSSKSRFRAWHDFVNCKTIGAVLAISSTPCALDGSNTSKELFEHDSFEALNVGSTRRTSIQYDSILKGLGTLKSCL